MPASWPSDARYMSFVVFFVMLFNCIVVLSPLIFPGVSTWFHSFSFSFRCKLPIILPNPTNSTKFARLWRSLSPTHVFIPAEVFPGRSLGRMLLWWLRRRRHPQANRRCAASGFNGFISLGWDKWTICLEMAHSHAFLRLVTWWAAPDGGFQHSIFGPKVNTQKSSHQAPRVGGRCRPPPPPPPLKNLCPDEPRKPWNSHKQIKSHLCRVGGIF